MWLAHPIGNDPTLGFDLSTTEPFESNFHGIATHWCSSRYQISCCGFSANQTSRLQASQCRVFPSLQNAESEPTFIASQDCSHPGPLMQFLMISYCLSIQTLYRNLPRKSNTTSKYYELGGLPLSFAFPLNRPIELPRPTN